MSKSQVENFGKYILLERIASGGMAEVYLAKTAGAAGIARFLAIKRILPQYSENPDFIEMFKEEAKIVVNLNHSNVVKIFDFGTHAGAFFLAMEYVEGQNLRQVLNHLKKENKYFTMDQIVFMINMVAAGLDHAHRCLDNTNGKPLNITHRDMSPQNIMISFEGEVKIVDFGIAKAETQMEQTRAGTIKGKFGYMSPEQSDGQQVDLRTDIFSLGTVLWELLAQDRLFVANSEAATLRKIRECQIPSLRKMNPSIPPELERICNKALAKDRSLRYQTSASFHRDLNRFLNTQYPDFSAHDFSVFMKSAFSQMFLENRKKLVEFSKIKAIENDDHTVTATVTATNTSSNVTAGLLGAASTSVGNAEFVIDMNIRDKITLSDLKQHETNTMTRRIPGQGFHTATSTGVFVPPMQTQSQIKRAADYTKHIVYAVTCLIIAVTGFQLNRKFGATVTIFAKEKIEYYVEKYKTKPIDQIVKNDKVDQILEHIDQSSKTNTQSASAISMSIVSIVSDPSGARIFIDGEDTRYMTPGSINVPTNKEFKVMLKRSGYLNYEITQKAIDPTINLRANLDPVPPMGYVTLILRNEGSDPVITVNEKRIDQSPPIKDFGIPAGLESRIKVYNPFSGLTAEQVVSVRENERKTLVLTLGNTAAPAPNAAAVKPVTAVPVKPQGPGPSRSGQKNSTVDEDSL